MTILSRIATAVFSFATVAFVATPHATLAQAQSEPAAQGQSHLDPSADTISGGASSAPHNWTADQIVTATVHQAWVLSGKDEANFFEIVKELAEISARNHNLVLPDDPAAGRRAGAYIKAQAKADPDQLLYSIVDRSVRMTGKPAPAVATTH